MRLQTYKEMALSSGPDKTVRAVGVCNFSARQLEELIRFCEKENIVKPAVVQNECHPMLPAVRVREICSKHGIVFQAYASLGSGGDTLMNHEVVKSIAKSHDRTCAQILLRWAVQHGAGRRTQDDKQVKNGRELTYFDFTLTSKDMSKLDSLSNKQSESQTTKFCWPTTVDHLWQEEIDHETLCVWLYFLVEYIHFISKFLLIVLSLFC